MLFVSFQTVERFQLLVAYRAPETPRTRTVFLLQMHSVFDMGHEVGAAKLAEKPGAALVNGFHVLLHIALANDTIANMTLLRFFLRVH